MMSVAAFTDTYLPTVNGVTYTVEAWHDRWRANGGRMDVVYPGTDSYEAEDGEHAVRSLPFPFYEGFRFGLPRAPRAVRDVDLVHTHTPFSLGLAGRRLARRKGLPFVASYHTPTREYASYLSGRDDIQRRVRAASERYERWFFAEADAVVVPSETTRTHVRERVGGDATVRVVPNGVDTDRFRPIGGDAFRQKHGLEGTVVGYTGRHGFEKRLADAVDAAAGLDEEVTLVFGGDGPARTGLEAQARAADVDARFLGFLDREELPAFYSSLDAFLFPSPVETQGLVALEANACGTPVVGVDSGALTDTIREGETGYRYELGDIDGFRDAVRRTLDERQRLREHCLRRREELSVDRAVRQLKEVYERVS